MCNWKTLFAAFLVFGTFRATVLADCSGVVGAETVSDGTWLVLLKGRWQPISELNSALADGRPSMMNFTYVAREPELTNFRRGILVIKTGLRAPAGSTDRVTLVREAYEPIEKCESYPRFPGGSVRGRSYDDYHDYSYNVERDDQSTIKTFHVTYAKRVQGCRRSDDDTSDSYFTGRWQSNRSQFSFTEGVVTGGQYSQFAAQFGLTPAYASSSLSARRVEIRPYNSDKNGLACVSFNAFVGPGAFIRINDLERRIGLSRAAEQSWEWPR
jgi:hypothetical protein